jgi:mono/diheme cytochrome c family protein
VSRRFVVFSCIAAIVAVVVAARRAGGQSTTRPAATAKAAAASAKPAASAPGVPVDGKNVFATICLACHQLNGEGIEDKYPPLAGSELAADDDGKIIRIILHGLTGPVEVQGTTFDGLMPPWGPTLKNAEIAAVATYVRSAWGNKAAPVTAARVAAIRAATRTRKTPWTAAELAKVVTVSK